MTLGELLAAAGLQARPEQVALARELAETLRPRTATSVAVQAATGVGKTWVAAHAALSAALEGRRVVCSTHTILLRDQMRSTLERALHAACPDPARRPALAERRGRADYPSPSRALRLRHALAERGAPREQIMLLDALAAWTGTIAEFVAANDELPVPQSLVCLTATCPGAEQAAYLVQRDAAASAGIVVQTHALTLIDARFGRLDADLVLFDEADTLPDVAAGAVEMRLPLDDIAALAERAGADIAAPISVCRKRGTEAGAIHWRDVPLAEAVRAMASELRAGVASADPELAETLRDTADDLASFASVDTPNSGAALVNDAAAGPMLAVAAVDAAGWLGAALKERQTVLMSATLGRHEEDDLAPFCRRLGFWDVRQVAIAPQHFGHTEFRLADRNVPLPLVGGVPQPLFFDYAADMVRQAAAIGRTLVLCASYADAEELARRLPAGAIIQHRGERLAPLVARFCANPDAVLVTPAAWAGLDLPYLIENVVILRLPVPRPDPLREAVLVGALTRRGRSDVDARAVLSAAAEAETLRRLTQGMGRGIRAFDDRCTIWIADPRFPLPGGMTTDLRRRLAVDAAAGRNDLARAIPRRFRVGAASAFERAQIVARVAPAAAA